jgi:hypothetical protein
MARALLPWVRPQPVKITRARIIPISDEPELGMLTLMTDQGSVRVLIGKDVAMDLREECLSLVGYPVSAD